MTLLGSLEDAGCRIAPQPGWSTATRPGTFAPTGVMWHWTASFSSPARPAPTLGVVINGRAGLSGPLYHLLVGHDGIVRVIHRRLGNHAGAGSLAAMQLAASGSPVPHGYRPGADTATLNRLAWGVAADYHPDQGPPPPQMVDGMVRATVGVCRFQGWPVPRGLDHRHATRRKIDNAGWPWLHPPVAALLAGGPAAPASPDEEDDVVKQGHANRNEVTWWQWKINEWFHGHHDPRAAGKGNGLVIDGQFGPRTTEYVMELQKRCGYAITGVIDLSTSSRVLDDLRRAAA